MKTLKTIFAAMLAAISLISFTACSDDDDEPATPAAKSVAGSYTADMSCSVMGQESVFENLTFKVNATDDSTVEIVIPAFGEAPMAMPSITVKGINVTGSNGTYKLAETTVNSTLDNGKSYEIDPISGEFKDNKLTVNFSLHYGSMPMAMICSFTAPKN